MKLKQPLMSGDAWGSICKCLTFSRRKSGSQVRWQKKQKDVITNERTEQRKKFKLGLELWQSLPDNEKHYWYLIEKTGYIIL